MLDFCELPSNGVLFEQLIRELLLRHNLTPFWTGRGPDSGRDLLAEETITGPLSDQRCLWLVDCKHFAKSGRSVGVQDVTDIKDRCARVNATGFLLVASTSPSSELVRKLDEVSRVSQLKTKCWDAVEIERRLLTPTKYAIAQQFFPKFARAFPWRLHYSERENRWMAHYLGNFLYVESRAGLEPPPLLDLQKIVEALRGISVGDGEQIRVRAIWHDTPNGPFYNCWFDYLVPSSSIPLLNKKDIARVLPECIAGGIYINWEANLQITLIHSDYYDIDDPCFYQRFKQPLYYAMFASKAELSSGPDQNWWKVLPPPIRSFNDAHMWARDKERHGFRNGVVVAPPYRPEL